MMPDRTTSSNFPRRSAINDAGGNDNKLSKKEVHEIIKEVSLGLCGTLVDITLFFVCFGAGYLLTSLTSYKGRVNLEPIKILLKEYPTLRVRLRNALHLAKRDGLLGDGGVTREGMRRVQEMLPRFKRHPVWSGSLWLVTYDILEKRKRDRELLRDFLLGQGYGKLQDSIYVAPFDPTELVREEVARRGIQGEVLISKLGADGHIGEMSITELISSVYDLESVHTRYRNFIQKMTHGFSPQEAPLLFLEYLSILKIDPQLPEELLPADWSGREAFELTRKTLLPHLLRDSYSTNPVLEHFEFGML